MSETDRILNDIRAYLRVTAAVASRPNAARVIDSQEKAAVYGKLDGNTPQAKIEQMTKVPNQTISRWLIEFVQEGLVTPPNEYYKSHKALYTLQELGIDLAVLKRRAKTSLPPQPTAEVFSPRGEGEKLDG